MSGAGADAVKTKFNGPIFLAGAIDGRVALIASVPKEMTSKFQANKIIQEIAPIVGGKGGGRPENAQGAGTDASKINQALDRAKKVFMGYRRVMDLQLGGKIAFVSGSTAGIGLAIASRLARESAE